MADLTPDCRTGYFICLLVYALFVVPFSCLNMGEQAVVQAILTFYRFFAFSVMFITVIIGLTSPASPHHDMEKPPLFRWSGFAQIFTTSAIALSFHFTVPDIIKPVRNKTYLREMTSSALVVASVFYLLMGILCSLYFGSSVDPLVTLNWRTYSGFDGGWGVAVDGRPWWAIAIQLVVMFFPILDMLSVFPLVAVTLGDNLVQFVPKHNIFKIQCLTGLAPQKKYQRKLTTILFRLIASIPPILCAAGVGQLNTIFGFTGLFSLFLTFILPPILHYQSKNFCLNEWGSLAWQTPYTMHISKNGYVVATLLFGLIAIVFSFFDFLVISADRHFWDKVKFD